MLLRSIRSRLLVLVLATVMPFVALVGAGLWSQWRSDQAAAIERALGVARLLAAQVDDHISDLESLLVGLSKAVSTDPADTSANDSLLRRVKAKLPDTVSNILAFSLDGRNIGTSAGRDVDRSYAGDRTFFQQIVAGQRLSIGEVIRTHRTGQWLLAIG
jgi:hypothetical protein